MRNWKIAQKAQFNDCGVGLTYVCKLAVRQSLFHTGKGKVSTLNAAVYPLLWGLTQAKCKSSIEIKGEFIYFLINIIKYSFLFPLLLKFYYLIHYFFIFATFYSFISFLHISTLIKEIRVLDFVNTLSSLPSLSSFDSFTSLNGYAIPFRCSSDWNRTHFLFRKADRISHQLPTPYYCWTVPLSHE